MGPSAARSCRLLPSRICPTRLLVSRQSINVLRRNNPVQERSSQCRFGGPPPRVSKVCSAAWSRTHRNLCVGVQNGISRSRSCTLNKNTSSLPQLQIKRNKKLGRRMPPMHACYAIKILLGCPMPVPKTLAVCNQRMRQSTSRSLATAGLICAPG